MLYASRPICRLADGWVCMVVFGVSVIPVCCAQQVFMLHFFYC